MVDEIVHGVLKKGYLTKKGHKRRNWKRRWFILQRTTMTYYESRENLTMKVRDSDRERERGKDESKNVHLLFIFSKQFKFVFSKLKQHLFILYTHPCTYVYNKHTQLYTVHNEYVWVHACKHEHD